MLRLRGGEAMTMGEVGEVVWAAVFWSTVLVAFRMDRCLTKDFLHLKHRYKRNINTSTANMTKSPSPAAGDPLIVKKWNPEDST